MAPESIDDQGLSALRLLACNPEVGGGFLKKKYKATYSYTTSHQAIDDFTDHNNRYKLVGPKFLAIFS